MQIPFMIVCVYLILYKLVSRLSEFAFFMRLASAGAFFILTRDFYDEKQKTH